MNREATRKDIVFVNWCNSYVTVSFLVRGGSRPLLAGGGYVSKDRGEANRDPSPVCFLSLLRCLVTLHECVYSYNESVMLTPATRGVGGAKHYFLGVAEWLRNGLQLRVRRFDSDLLVQLMFDKNY